MVSWRTTLLVALALAVGLHGAARAAGKGNPMVVLSTSMGDIKVELYADKAPISTKNFLEYAKAGYYDGTIFHRVIPGFMIQGGDPNTISGNPSTWGVGGSGKNVNAEFRQAVADSN